MDMTLINLAHGRKWSIISFARSYCSTAAICDATTYLYNRMDTVNNCWPLLKVRFTITILSDIALTYE